MVDWSLLFVCLFVWNAMGTIYRVWFSLQLYNCCLLRRTIPRRLIPNSSYNILMYKCLYNLELFLRLCGFRIFLVWILCMHTARHSSAIARFVWRAGLVAGGWDCCSAVRFGAGKTFTFYEILHNLLCGCRLWAERRCILFSVAATAASDDCLLWVSDLRRYVAPLVNHYFLRFEFSSCKTKDMKHDSFEFLRLNLLFQCWVKQKKKTHTQNRKTIMIVLFSSLDFFT